MAKIITQNVRDRYTKETITERKFIHIDLLDDQYEITPIGAREDCPGPALKIYLTQQYDSPASGTNLFKVLSEISQFFGTQEMDNEEVRQQGCDTCDFGSRYGFELYIFGITKNYPF